MEVLPVDLPTLAANILGITTILIPITGFTIRFALKPLVEAIAMARAAKGRQAEAALLEQRVQLLERQVDLLQRALPQGNVVDLSERARTVQGS